MSNNTEQDYVLALLEAMGSPEYYGPDMEEHDKRILRDTLNRRALDLKEKFEEERKLVKGLAKEDKRRKELKKTRKISPRLCLTLPRVF